MRRDLYLWKYFSLARKVADNLNKKGHDAYIVKDTNEALKKVLELIPENSSVATGGSLTLNQIKLLDALRNGNYIFYDRYSAKSKEEKYELERKAFFADYYICSANAITENGEIALLDGNGNRVAAVIYGPKNVILVTSVNKIVSNLLEARERIRYISPMNSKRLDLNTPCTQTGYCINCASAQRICNYYTIIESDHRHPGRIKVILVLEELGL
ncbi:MULTISPECIES: lactate utilization protein [unclassified Thermosipho (in: thermotogales)]|uniref:lactate utilization protein n=1 Tax=unclassified Thermosipho (in: thermotogales) TaxID=2676525 RepID=UPI0009493807|nr:MULTISPECIES: lactate utilization protein [unclassified Thermosipho (in: thermotogales)]ANQ54131.1 membrane protein [Thermosipho sp. 1070]OOC41976.1 membrane protein [Thermosipho sp. 1074]